MIAELETPSSASGAARAKAKQATTTTKADKKASGTAEAQEFVFRVPTKEFASLPIPGLEGVSVGTVYSKVTEIPETLDSFMEVNPRVPNRTAKGVLSGPVIKGILSTLRDEPETMAVRNQGIYLLINRASYQKGFVTVSLSDPRFHGIINGGHTYAAIREAIDTADEDVIRDVLSRAYVPLHLYEGVDPKLVYDIAEGLNRSKQVDDPSLANLQGDFDRIRKVMANKQGHEAIAYHQGSSGELYISDVLVFLEMFNKDRFTADKHPSYLYNRSKSALEFFQKDLEAEGKPLDKLIPLLPDILRLYDKIREATPAAAKKVGFEFGRMKTGKRATARTAKTLVNLPFIGGTMNYRVPDGWLYPMLAAFRANLQWDSKKNASWIKPNDDLLPLVIERLVGVCVTAHRSQGVTPDKVGKLESIYSSCYDKIQLYLISHRGE